VADTSSPHAEGLRDGESTFRMLAVSSSAQGRGTGEALVRRCLAEARALGASGVFIYSGEWMRAAHRLYGRLGFRREPERDWVIEEPPIHLFGFRLDLDDDGDRLT